MSETQVVQTRLQASGFSVKEPEVLDVCVSLANEFGIPPETVAADYEIMNSLKENCSMDICTSNVSSKAFRDFLAKQYSAPAKAPPTRVVGSKQPFGNSWENVSDKEAALYQPTPKRQAMGTTPGSTRTSHQARFARTPVARPSPSVQGPSRQDAADTPSASAVKFESRTAKGDLVSVLNEHLPEWDASLVTRSSPVDVEAVGELLPPAGQHLFMTETLETKVQAIDERLMDFAEHLTAMVPEAREGKVNALSQITHEPSWYVGRVVLESGTEDVPSARLSVGSLYLEGCRSLSDGARVRLDVSALQSGQGCRLFPGQVVAVKGVNTTGHLLVAQSVCTTFAPPPATTTQAVTTPLCVVVAAGPYCTAEDLCFAPLDHLLQHCQARNPDLVVLLGPFVDTEHAVVQGGMLDRTLDTVFQQEVVQRVTTWQSENPRTRVLLLPSTRDAHHAPVQPTPAFALPAAGATGPGAQPSVVTSYSSPCVLNVAGSMQCALTSADVLKALSGCELNVGNTGTDRMTALAGHIVGQRSFYPVYPPALGACVDLSHSAALQLHTTPHVLVLPSDLAPFAKVLSLPQPGQDIAAQQQVVCINPGRAIRGLNAGTFALVCVYPGEQGVASRSRVEIRRV